MSYVCESEIILMQDYQRQFIEFALDLGALRFGRFTLKSGRSSPYFFNTGLFNTGARLARLGQFYARALMHAGVEFDMLFGPAYKGIPLVAAVAIVLSEYHGRDVPYCFNRKEVKEHAEGGLTVGAVLSGRVLIVDDVISAGTSVRESVRIITGAGASPCGVAIALNRRERGTGGISEVREVEQTYHIPVISIIGLDDLITYLSDQPEQGRLLEEIRAYQMSYGAD